MNYRYKFITFIVIRYEVLKRTKMKFWDRKIEHFFAAALCTAISNCRKMEGKDAAPCSPS